MISRSLHPSIFSISWWFFIKCLNLIQYISYISTYTISTTQGKQILNDKNYEEDSRIFNSISLIQIRFHLFKPFQSIPKNYWIKTTCIPTLQHMYNKQTSHQHASSQYRAMIYKYVLSLWVGFTLALKKHRGSS